MQKTGVRNQFSLILETIGIFPGLFDISENQYLAHVFKPNGGPFLIDTTLWQWQPCNAAALASGSFREQGIEVVDIHHSVVGDFFKVINQ